MTDAINNDPFADHNEPINYVDVVTKKFNKDGQLDIEGLAKGKFEADKHIATLEAELAEVRKKAEQGIALKDLMEAIKSNRSDNEEPPLVQPKEGDPAAKQSEIPVEELVQNALTRAETERREAANKQAVVDKLNEVWGSNTAAELRKVSQSLGIPVKELEEMGKKSPPALFKLLGIDTPRTAPGGTTVPTSTVLPKGTHGGVRNWNYYNELRKSNPKLYADPKIQAQEMRDALEQGEAFFN